MGETAPGNMTSEDSNFRDGHLRLSVFLRLVEHIPQRPSRIRPSTSTADAPAQESHVTPLPSNASLGACVDEPLPAIEEQVQPPQPPDLELSVSNAAQTDSRRREVSNTRNGRQSVKELALVRTTTAEGLPDRSGDNGPPALPLSEIDPIEDSQLLQHRQAPHLEHKLIPAGKSTTSVTQRAPRAKLPWIPPRSHKLLKKALAPARPVRPVVPPADGFSGTELSIPSGTLQKKKVVKVAKRHPVPTTTACLVLRSGALPVPSMSCEAQSSEQPISASGVSTLAKMRLKQTGGALPQALTVTLELTSGQTQSQTPINDDALPEFHHATAPTRSASKLEVDEADELGKEDSGRIMESVGTDVSENGIGLGSNLPNMSEDGANSGSNPAEDSDTLRTLPIICEHRPTVTIE